MKIRVLGSFLQYDLRSTNLGQRLLTRQSKGILIVLFSATSFGAVTPFARIAYINGINMETVMVARYALASVAIALFLAGQGQLRRHVGKVQWKALVLALLLGMVSYLYFGSIKYIPVSLSVLIFYTYPIMVSLLVYFTRKRKSPNEDTMAHYIAFGGQMLSLVGLLFLLGLSWDTANIKGIVLAAVSAISYALVFVFAGRLLRSISPMVLNLSVAVVNTVFFASIAMWITGFSWPTHPQAWIGLLGVAVFFTIGFLVIFVGVRLIGASRAACLKNIEPLTTIALAYTLLGEPLSIWQFLGAGAVLFGILIMCRNIIFGLDPLPSQKEKVYEAV